MKTLFKLFFVVVLWMSSTITAQTPEVINAPASERSKPKWPTNTALQKGGFVVSFLVSGQGFGMMQPNEYYLDYTFNPKCNYFILNKLSIGLGYLGMSTTSSEFPQYNGYSHNAEAEINYFFHSRPHSFMSIQAGFVYGQPKSSMLQSFPGALQTHSGSMVKFGAAITRRLKCNENFGLTFNPAVYFDVKNVTPFNDNFYCQFNAGINYFISSIKK